MFYLAPQLKPKHSKGAGYGWGGVNAGIYTPINTISQAGVGFTGTHLNLLGLDPSSQTSGGLNNYFDVIKSQEKEDNRLINLTSNEDPVNILEYSGGPGSILGIGNTSIKFVDQRTGDKNPQAVSNPTQFYVGERKKRTNFVNYTTIRSC